MEDTCNFNLEKTGIQETSDRSHLVISDIKNQLSKSKLKRQLDLIELTDKLYESMPPKCWYTEKNLAKKLGVSVRKIRNAKRYLLEIGKIQIKQIKNGNRTNPKHYIYKTKSIVRPNKPLQDECGVNWESLCSHSPQRFNALSFEEKLDIYEEMGIPFFPMHFPKFSKDGEPYCSCMAGRYCESIGKHPAIILSEYDFSEKATLKKMRRFFDGMDDCDIPKECKESNDKRDSRFNIGFLTNGFSVIDIDFRNGGAYSLRDFEENYGELPRNLMAKTGNGLHFYTSSVINTTVNLLGFGGIDVRSMGGFVIAPGSLHKSGRYYEWQSLWTPESLHDGLLVELQEQENVMSIRGGKSRNLYVPKSLDEDYLIKDGARSDTLFKIAIRERYKGKEYEEILSVIEKFNTQMCKPPFKQRQLEHIAGSASRYSIGKKTKE
jgi:Bifunctional DNA primase/polymerase, N-terminal/Primase C terminal 1 (PriCT-1)